jgi:hypothetical protein
MTCQHCPQANPAHGCVRTARTSHDQVTARSATTHHWWPADRRKRPFRQTAGDRSHERASARSTAEFRPSRWPFTASNLGFEGIVAPSSRREGGRARAQTARDCGRKGSGRATQRGSGGPRRTAGVHPSARPRPGSRHRSERDAARTDESTARPRCVRRGASPTGLDTTAGAARDGGLLRREVSP